jgi:hypothetical protein
VQVVEDERPAKIEKAFTALFMSYASKFEGSIPEEKVVVIRHAFNAGIVFSSEPEDQYMELHDKFVRIADNACSKKRLSYEQLEMLQSVLANLKVLLQPQSFS